MAIVLKQSPYYRWTCSIVLTNEEGKKVKSRFDVKFKRISSSRIEEIVAAAKAIKEEDASSFDLLGTLLELIADWDGVEETPGKPLPFDEEALAALLEVPSVGAQILEEWFNSVNHQKGKS